MNTRANNQASSLAGLLAARVLADHFDHVTIIERDAWSFATLPKATGQSKRNSVDARHR